MKVSWAWKRFDMLSAMQVHDMLAVRQLVFVLEQQCIYLDIDGFDKKAWHLLGYDASGLIVSYARLLPPNTRYVEPSIGRVLVLEAARGNGLGHQLIQRSIDQCKSKHPNHNIRISAQVYLQGTSINPFRLKQRLK